MDKIDGKAFVQSQIDIGVLKADAETRSQQIDSLCDKLDVTLDKLQELTLNMTKILTMHTEKLDFHDKMDKDLSELIEKRRVEFVHEIKEVHSRISTVNRELVGRIETIKESIAKEMKDLIVSIREESNKLQTVVNTQQTSFSARLGKIEIKYWMIAGGVAVIGWLVSKIPFANIAPALGKLLGLS